MPDVILAPIVQRSTLHDDVAQELAAYLQETLFAPLEALLADNGVTQRKNAVEGSAVVFALAARTLWYAQGAFTGQLNAAISRELRQAGAKKDERTKLFRLPVEKLPMDWRIAISGSTEAARQVHQKMLDTLNQMEENLRRKPPTGIKAKGPLEKILSDLYTQFSRSLTPHSIGVPPDLTDAVKTDIFNKYTTNLDLFITDFAKKRIPVLRRKVQENIFAGGRTDRLAQMLQVDFGMSKRKAAFVAEQETSLLVSTYRESRYKEIGARRYVWSTSQDGRVRHDHRSLNGKTFDWDHPPITNKDTRARNNPGEDFGCRCIARPILNIQEE